ncbi:MAG: hypothetical protein ABI592_05525 [Acidobacteriota bacterium]
MATENPRSVRALRATSPRVKHWLSELLVRPGILALAPAFVSVVFALHGCSGDADFSDVMPEPVTLSAEAYRSEIAGIDRLVFDEGPFMEKRGAELAESLENLARRVKAASDSRFLAIESLELRHLASVSKGLSADAPRARLQSNWIRLRSNLFDDREWFARSAADLPHPREALQVKPSR